MRTPAQIAGHPIHPMLVALPIGMWVFSLAADLFALRTGSATWEAAALYSLIGGILGALAAAAPGVVDMLSLKEPEVKGTALRHMMINLTVVALYAVNAWLRLRGSGSPGLTLGLSVLAILMLLVSGWLGGKMVYEAGVAVHAQDTAASSDSWGPARPASGRGPSVGGRSFGERAMAADRERAARKPDGRPQR